MKSVKCYLPASCRHLHFSLHWKLNGRAAAGVVTGARNVKKDTGVIRPTCDPAPQQSGPNKGGAQLQEAFGRQGDAVLLQAAADGLWLTLRCTFRRVVSVLVRKLHYVHYTLCALYQRGKHMS